MWKRTFGVVTLATLLASSTISCRRPCPACPAAPIHKPEVIVAPRVPCSLPNLPQPITLGGVPAVDGSTVTVTKDGLAALAGYLVAVRAWIGAAGACLAAEGP